jgi:hypothetical protein
VDVIRYVDAARRKLFESEATSYPVGPAREWIDKISHDHIFDIVISIKRHLFKNVLLKLKNFNT